jgi:serine phosphatase RsbU (regulator of sigma subunit)
MQFRPRELNASDVAEITLMSPGDILVLYTDGVYDGSDEEERDQLEMILRERETEGASHICNALLDYAVEQDDHLRQIGAESSIDDKTVFIIKRLETSSS